MKWKEFMSSTLPRFRRSKSRRASATEVELEPPSTKAQENPLSQSFHANAGTFDSYWADNIDVACNINSKCGHFATLLSCQTEASDCQSLTRVQGEKPYCELNKNSSTNSPDTDSYDCTLENIHYDSEGPYTFAKQRSRIRTNPWLPSPTASPRICNMTSPFLTSLDGTPESRTLEYVRVDYVRVRSNLSQHYTSMSESGFYSLGSPEIMTDSSTPPIPSANEYETNPFQFCVNLQDSSSEEGDYSCELSVHENNIPSAPNSTSLPRLQSCKYEEDFDAMLESCDILSTNGDSFDLDVFESESHLAANDMITNSTATSAVGETTQYECVKLSSLQQLANKPNDRLRYLEYLDSINNTCINNIPDTVSSEPDNVFPAKAYSDYLKAGGNPAETLNPDDILFSLQEKIELLRAEKRLVDDLIRKAKEEETLKRQIRKQISSEANLAIKQVLRRTLSDLKEKLNSHTDRLQCVYGDVIVMQYDEVRQRKSSSV